MQLISPESLKDQANHYCPGCSHGVIQRIIGEVIDEMGIREDIVAIAPVGCAVFGYFYWDFDTTEAPHGRPPAVATGIKRMLPDKIVFSYQGDGDLIAIGGNELLHTANRGENVTIFFVNNACYGMTGGQMAPTTMSGQVTTTTSEGRGLEDGVPLRVCEMLSQIDGVAYLERVAVTSPRNLAKAKRAVKKALQYQQEKKGFSLVEFLSMCPEGWHLTPVESLKVIDEEMTAAFPVGVYKE